MVCRLSSNSNNRDVVISKVNIQLNPEFKNHISCNINGGMLGDMDDEVRLCPGETYETVFPFKIKKSFNMQATNHFDGENTGASENLRNWQEGS